MEFNIEKINTNRYIFQWNGSRLLTNKTILSKLHLSNGINVEEFYVDCKNFYTIGNVHFFTYDNAAVILRKEPIDFIRIEIDKKNYSKLKRYIV